MKKLSVLWSFLFLLAWSANSEAFAQQPKEIIIASEKWDKCTHEDGSGAYFDLFRMIYEPAGVKVVHKIMPYGRSVQTTKAGKADAWMAAYWEEEDWAVWPNKSHWINYDKVVATSKKGTPYTSQKEVTGKKVGWTQTFSVNSLQ